MAHTYPMMLDVTDRRVVIVGGGAVAVRKARGLLWAGARHIRVVALHFNENLPGQVERLAEAYRPEHLQGAGLVFAATDDPLVNGLVVQECRRRGLLVCRADAPSDGEQNDGDFLTPALHQEGDLAVMVSAGGSPALAAMARDALAKAIDPRWVKMAGALRILRPMIRDLPGLDIARRRQIFHDLASNAAMDVVDQGLVPLCQWLRQRHPELSRLPDPNPAQPVTDGGPGTNLERES